MAYVVARLGNNIHKITGVSSEKSLTEAFLGWSCLGEFLKENTMFLHTPRNKYVREFIKKTNTRRENCFL